MELWLDFVYLLANNEYFRSGFFSGIVLCVVVAVVLRMFFVIDNHWKKFRQFFEPTKNPGKMPVEIGPSPASMSLGCMGRVFFALFFITVMILLVWSGFPES